MGAILREDWSAVRALAARLLSSLHYPMCLDGIEALRLMDEALALDVGCEW